jgi:hypothetical protein
MRWAGRRGFADRVPGAGARGLPPARSIFELKLSAIGLSLRAAQTDPYRFSTNDQTGHSQTASAQRRLVRRQTSEAVEQLQRRVGFPQTAFAAGRERRSAAGAESARGACLISTRHHQK